MAKRRIKAKKRIKKSVKVKKKRASKQKSEEVGFEEVIVKCPSCGRDFRIVKSFGFSTEGMLCQRCSAGGGVGLEEDDDF